MILYHMSQTLIPEEEMKNDFEKKSRLTLPFVDALEKGVDFYTDLVVSGQSQRTVPLDLVDLERCDYIKWCVEGAFEFIRKTEFPGCCSRSGCKYFFDNLENFKILYEAGWKQESEEKRARIHLYEIELEDDNPQKFDMVLYDQAYDALYETQDVRTVLDLARKYYSGQSSSLPVWEFVSEKPARAVKDISFFLETFR